MSSTACCGCCYLAWVYRTSDRHRPDVQNAFAVLTAADLDQLLTATADVSSTWLDWADSVFAALQHPGGDRDPIVAAQLLALGTTMNRFRSPDHDHLITATFARMFTLTGRPAPRQPTSVASPPNQSCD